LGRWPFFVQFFVWTCEQKEQNEQKEQKEQSLKNAKKSKSGLDIWILDKKSNE
jgi:hypothetical protein